jgi:hypothetical protein
METLMVRSRMAAPCRAVILLVVLVAGLGARSAAAQVIASVPLIRDSVRPHTLDTITVVGRVTDLIGIAHSASEGRIGALDLRARPLAREGELLESVPGVILTQHSGDGKANQIFVRGFNLDHGTDFQTTFEGMPVNEPSHAHGQGYTDLNFIIPELVESIDYKLGVHHVDVGDFGSAGAAQFHLAHTLDHDFVTASAGAFGFARLAAGNATRIGNGTLLLGGETKAYDGPWDLPERVRKFSGVARYSWTSGASAFSILAMGYHNQWHASDQIPQRAVDEGLISRFGQIDSTLGGATERYSLSGSWKHAAGRSVDEVQVYGIYSSLDLFSNFTYFLNDPVNGDQINQREHRITLGGSAKHAQEVTALDVTHLMTVGVQGRFDIINGLGLHQTAGRQRLSTVREDDVRELGTGLYGELESRWTPWFRSVLGGRLDAYTFNVNSDLAANSGHRTAGIASPKASFVFTVAPSTELYLSGGLGFHSNDARGTTITVDPVSGQPVQRVDPLVRSRGAEIGLRTSPVHGLRSTVTLWALELNSELLFTGDGGTTEASNRSRRYGVTWANFYRPIPQLSLDADISLAHARYEDVDSGQVRIPGALENVIAAGATWQASSRGWFGVVRLRHFGAYPLIEDNSTRAIPTTLVNADVGYLFDRVRVQVSMLNVFNQLASDIQYYYASRLPGESADGVNDAHFHPVEPRQVRLSVSWGI